MGGSTADAWVASQNPHHKGAWLFGFWLMLPLCAIWAGVGIWLQGHCASAKVWRVCRPGSEVEPDATARQRFVRFLWMTLIVAATFAAACVGALLWHYLMAPLRSA